MRHNISSFIACILLTWLPLLLKAQPENGVTELDSLKSLFLQLYLQEKDQAKKSLNRDIMEYFSRVLSNSRSFQYSFDSLDMIGKLTAPDRSFRIFTWNIPMEGFTHEYYGLIQKTGSDKDKCHIYRLENGIPLGNHMIHSTYTHEQWPGALYYEIHRNKYAGEVFYTLLGFHFKDRFSDMKVIDALSFPDEGGVLFGKPVFRTPEGIQHRIVFEYSGNVVMNMRYEPRKKMIVLDHLSPIEPELKGHPRFYAPDFSYDGYKFRRGAWEYRADIDVRNR